MSLHSLICVSLRSPLAANDSPVPYRCQTSPFEPKPVYPLPEFAPRPGVRPYFCGTVMPRMGGTIPQLPVIAGPWNNLSRFNTTQSNAMIPQMRTQPPNCPPFVTQRNPSNIQWVRLKVY